MHSRPRGRFPREPRRARSELRGGPVGEFTPSPTHALFHPPQRLVSEGGGASHRELRAGKEAVTAGGRSRAGFRCSDPSPCPSSAAAELPASRPQRPRPERGGVGSPPPGAVRSVRWTLRAQRRALGLEGWTTGLHWARLLRTGGGRARSCPCSLSSLTADRTPPRKEEPRCGGSKVAHSAQQGCGAGGGLGPSPAPVSRPCPHTPSRVSRCRLGDPPRGSLCPVSPRPRG